MVYLCAVFPYTHLCRCGCVPVAGQDFEGDASIDVFQHLLQRHRIAAHLLAVQLPYDVARVQHALLVDHAAMENARDHKLAVLHSECHALKKTTCFGSYRLCLHAQKVAFTSFILR